MKPADVLTPYDKLLPKVAPTADPLDDPVFWRAVVEALGLNPMPCTYSIRKISAEHGVDPDRAYARFLAHFHEAPWEWKQ